MSDDKQMTADESAMVERAYAAGVEVVSAWQPIATAPKDGREILVTTGYRCAVVYWADINAADSEYGTRPHNAIWGWLFCDGHNGPIWYRAWPYITHWQPLPEQPT